MPPIAVALIVILAVHYFFAIATIFVLLRDKGVTKAIIPWNLVILLLPIAGPLAYWLYRLFSKKPPQQKGNAEDYTADGQEAEEEITTDGGTDARNDHK